MYCSRRQSAKCHQSVAVFHRSQCLSESFKCTFSGFFRTFSKTDLQELPEEFSPSRIDVRHLVLLRYRQPASIFSLMTVFLRFQKVKEMKDFVLAATLAQIKLSKGSADGSRLGLPIEHIELPWKMFGVITSRFDCHPADLKIVNVVIPTGSSFVGLKLGPVLGYVVCLCTAQVRC